MQRIFFLVVLVLSSCHAQLSINTQSRFIQDQYSRTTILHGVNIVYKVPPYIPSSDQFDPQLSLTDDEIIQLKEWGFNFVRLGVMWEAVERVQGEYNMTYLEEVSKLINKLGEQGIYTLVDAHQDVFARRICGEGVPDFYATYDMLKHKCSGIVGHVLELIGACKSIYDYGFEFDSNGDPLIEDCQKNNFATYYSSPESVSAFTNLYNNVDGLQDKFIAYWGQVSDYFANNKYVVGYDPLNEPGPAEYFTEPSEVLVPGKFDKTLLQPMYKQVYDRYQQTDKSKIMFFEPTQFPDEIGVGNKGIVRNLGFTEAPGGADNLDTQVLNDHTYCCQLNAKVCATGEPSLDMKDECLAWHQKRVGTRSADAKRYGVPLIISEFGACLDSESCVQEITSVGQTCDQNLVGWAYWELKKFGDLTTSAGTGSEGFYNDDGSLQTQKVKALARTYLQYTQGIPVSMTFDQETNDLIASFILNTQIQQPTVIFASRDYYYPNGYTLKLTDSNGNELTSTDVIVDINESNYLSFQVINHNLNGTTINVALYTNPTQFLA